MDRRKRMKIVTNGKGTIRVQEEDGKFVEEFVKIPGLFGYSYWTPRNFNSIEEAEKYVSDNTWNEIQKESPAK
jgi:hypothetical protein